MDQARLSQSPLPRAQVHARAAPLSSGRLHAHGEVGFPGRPRRDLVRRRRLRRVGKTRESAYRLRDKPGAESFAAAWDAILAEPRRIRKSTHELLWHRLFYGTLKPVMRGGRHVATLHSPDNDAVFQLYRREMQRRRLERRLERKSR